MIFEDAFFFGIKALRSNKISRILCVFEIVFIRILQICLNSKDIKVLPGIYHSWKGLMAGTYSHGGLGFRSFYIVFLTKSPSDLVGWRSPSTFTTGCSIPKTIQSLEFHKRNKRVQAPSHTNITDVRPMPWTWSIWRNSISLTSSIFFFSIGLP